MNIIEKVNAIKIEKFVTILFGNDGKRYTLSNDGGNGPMSTGTDEWSGYSNSDDIGLIMSEKKIAALAKLTDEEKRLLNL